ncbi:MAG: porin [Rhizobacter sp.]
MKANAFAVLVLACVSLNASAARADEFKVYGAVDASLMYQSQNRKLSMQSSGTKSTFLGFRGSKKMPLDWLEAGFVFEAAFAVDNGTGSPSNLNNTADTANPKCTVTGAPGATCTVSNDAAQGIVFQRESRIRFLLGRGNEPEAPNAAGKRHQLSLGRYYTPAYANLAKFSGLFGVTGVGSPLTLGSASQGPTAIRASNSISYLSPSLYGLSFSAMYALGERGFFEDGDLLGGQMAFDRGAIHFGTALQYTKHAAADVGVASMGASVALGPVTLAALGQYTKLFAQVPWFATYAHFQGSLKVSHEGTVQLAADWLEVRHLRDDSGQFTAGYKQDVSKDLSLYAKAGYVMNLGKAVNRSPGTAELAAGQDALATSIGATLLF